jgi:hypothetical protein
MVYLQIRPGHKLDSSRQHYLRANRWSRLGTVRTSQRLVKMPHFPAIRKRTRHTSADSNCVCDGLFVIFRISRTLFIRSCPIIFRIKTSLPIWLRITGTSLHLDVSIARR